MRISEGRRVGWVSSEFAVQSRPEAEVCRVHGTGKSSSCRRQPSWAIRVWCSRFCEASKAELGEANSPQKKMLTQYIVHHQERLFSGPKARRVWGLRLRDGSLPADQTDHFTIACCFSYAPMVVMLIQWKHDWWRNLLEHPRLLR
jgi:hypothetical protein